MAVLIQLQVLARLGMRKVTLKDLPQALEQYHGWLSTMTFLDPQPPAMGDYSFKSDRILGGDGANLSGVLYNLCSNPETKEALLEFIKTLPEQDIKDITFIETPRDEVMVRLTETFGGVASPCDAPLLSDDASRPCHCRCGAVGAVG